MCVATAWFCYLIAKPFLKPIFFALILAIIFYPFYGRVHRLVSSRNWAAFISTLLVLLTILIPATLLGVAIRRDLAEVYQTLSAQSNPDGGVGLYLLHVIERFTGWLGKYLDLSQFNLRATLLERLQEASSVFLRQAASVVGNLFSLAVDGIVAFITLFFLFRDGRALYRRLAVITPLRPDQVERLTSDISKVITASMYGGLAVAAVQGALTSLAFWVLGLASPILWGVAAAIFSFVPLVGSSLVWLPASILLIVTGQWPKGLVLIAWGAGIVGMADNVIRPYVISGQMKFHPLYIFFALFGGVQVFGILGLFVGPVVLAIAYGVFGLIREEIRPGKRRN